MLRLRKRGSRIHQLFPIPLSVLPEELTDLLPPLLGRISVWSHDRGNPDYSCYIPSCTRRVARTIYRNCWTGVLLDLVLFAVGSPSYIREDKAFSYVYWLSRTQQGDNQELFASTMYWRKTKRRMFLKRHIERNTAIATLYTMTIELINTPAALWTTWIDRVLMTFWITIRGKEHHERHLYFVLELPMEEPLHAKTR